MQTLQKIRNEGDHADPGGGKEAEQFGGAALGGAGVGKEPTAGAPPLTPWNIYKVVLTDWRG